MQFEVPQFTDVEDKLIGILTFKQFGIVFVAGVFIFLFYSATKSIPVLVVTILLFGLPAALLAFGKLNGRPMYHAIGYYAKFVASPKFLVFHKEVNTLSQATKLKDAGIAKTADGVQGQVKENSKTRLLEVQRLLEKQAAEEKKLVKNI